MLKGTTLAAAILCSTVFAANGDGYKMSVCSNDKSKLCYDGKEIFLNGMNVAWWNFGQDVGKDANGKIQKLDENSVRKDLKDLRDAGGNSIRWWLYTNNSMDPSFDATTNYATGIETQTIDNVQMVLDIAEEYGIVVDLCLLSFDMMKESYSDGVSWGSRFNFKANKLILEDSVATRAFIDKAVLPLVKKFKDHPALLSWEVFNEPEGMTSTENFGNGWGTTLVDISYIQRVINMVADAIHNEAPSNLVSNGSARFTMTSDKCGTNYYSDTKLLASGGNKYSKGTLDFYQVHYYPEWNPNNASPFHNPYSYYQLDKPMVIGELPGASWNNISSGGNLSSDPAGSRAITIDSAYTYAFRNGYSGALGWTLHEEKSSDFYGSVIWSLENSKSALAKIYALDSGKVKLKDASASVAGQNGWMKVTYSNTDASKGADLTYSFTQDLSSATSITFTVKNNATSDLQYTMALKTNDKDSHQAWGWYNANSICDVAAGQTLTCSFPINKFAYWKDNFPVASNLGNLFQVIIKLTTDKFSGEVLIDNVKVDDSIVINNFDTEFDTFTPGTETITKVETYYDGTPATPTSSASSVNSSNSTTSSASANNSSTSSVSSSNSSADSAGSNTDSASSSNSSGNNTAIGAGPLPAVANLTLQGNSLSFTTARSGNVSLDVFDLQGNRVANLYKGTLSAGTHQFNLSGMARGSYLVRAKGAGLSATKRIVIK